MESKRILIVDDDAELCDELAEVIREEGYTVETTTNSVHGAGLIKKKWYDVVILDFKMPDMTAVDILKEIKGTDPRPTFILLSGKPFVEELIKQENLSGMVDAVFSKPFDYALFLRKIRESCLK